MPLLERTSEGPEADRAGETPDRARRRRHLPGSTRPSASSTEIAGLEGGRVRLISFPTASATLVTRAMADCSGSASPRSSSSCGRGSRRTRSRALRAGEYRHRGRSSTSPALPEDFGRDLERELILEETMRVALPPGHPLAASRRSSSRTSPTRTGSAASAGSCREHVIRAAATAGFEPRISFESDDYQVLQGLVAAGLGVTLLPELALATSPGVELRDRSPAEPDPPGLGGDPRGRLALAGDRGDGGDPGARSGSGYRPRRAEAPSPLA